MKKNKTIKTTTLQGRFEKLHLAANYAEECAQAIAFHANRLCVADQSAPQAAAYMQMTEDINNWCDKFAQLASSMQSVEEKYYAHLQNNNTECELIEEVPSYKKHGYAVPDSFSVDDMLFEIGYHELEGDPYLVAEHDFSEPEIVNDIQVLMENMIRYVKALANADYNGIWKPVGDLAIEIHDTIPTQSIDNLLVAYGYDKTFRLCIEF